MSISIILHMLGTTNPTSFQVTGNTSAQTNEEYPALNSVTIQLVPAYVPTPTPLPPVGATFNTGRYRNGPYYVTAASYSATVPWPQYEGYYHVNATAEFDSITFHNSVITFFYVNPPIS